MKLIKQLLILLILSSFFACQMNAGYDEESIRTEVKATFESYSKRLNNEGLESITHYFSSDERFYWVEDGIVQYPDKETLLSAVTDFAPMVSTVDFKASEVEVDVLDQHTALLYAAYVEKLTLTSGYVVDLDGAMTILMRQEGNDWKFLMGHSSIKKERGGN